MVGQNDKEVSINEEANKVHQAISEEFPVVNKDFECSDVANHVDSEELKKDTIGTFWMTVGQNECFQEEITSYVVELPSNKQNTPEVREAKRVELKNLQDYETFEEVEDCGQDRISSRWVVTAKEAHDGQKTKTKARLVARGFQENHPPQSDSPTVLRESNKLFSAVAANEDFDLVSVDIRAAFLQSKELQRDVFVVPPKDVAKVGVLWKLKKPLYGLNDASRLWYVRLITEFEKLGLKRSKLDNAIFYYHDNGRLIGVATTHVDDVVWAGTNYFKNKVIKAVKETFKISRESQLHFIYLGLCLSKMRSVSCFIRKNIVIS